MAELVCPTHGPYDSSYGVCPYCSGTSNRPAAPAPLDDDDLATDISAGGGHQGGWSDDNDPTELGQGGDTDFGDKTDIGYGGRHQDMTEFEVVDESAIAILWVKEGRRRGRIHPIKDGYVVGRSKGEIVLDDPKVSNPHARFRYEDEKFELWDFGSRNGTFVNDERIKSATVLNENDVIKFGDELFVFKVLD